MISNVFKILIHAYYFFMHHSIFDSYFSLSDMRPLFDILKTLLSFFYFVQYKFTCNFLFCFHDLFKFYFFLYTKYGIQMK